MLHRDRMRFTGVRANEQDRLAVMHVVERVGHRPVTPGVRHARHGGGVADTRLVVGIVGAPQRSKLTH